MNSSFTQWHENERLVAVAQTSLGRLVLWTAAILLLAWHESNLLMLVAFTLVMFYPARRRFLLSLAAFGIIVDGLLRRMDLEFDVAFLVTGLADSSQWLLLMGQAAMVLGLLYLAFLVVLRFDQWPTIIKRYPVLSLHSGIWMALMLSTLPWLGVLVQVSFLAWRMSYLVKFASRGMAAGTKFHDHLFYLMPVFGGSSTPYGKGLDFLSRHEARDSVAFARSQLAGIKLLLLAIMWLYLRDLMDAAIFGQTDKPLAAWFGSWTLNLPHLAEFLQAEINPPWYQGWGVIYLELIRDTLKLAAFGHVIVGSLRLLGFNVFRNTYKPLLAESIVEFWNRYYFYFKELLVEFFFYPIYLRLRSTSPRLRLFAAIFAAAFLGNMYYHLLYQPEAVINLDFAYLWAKWGARTVYCFLLVFGIWVSMLRQQKQRQANTAASFPIRLRRIAGVWTFYAIIQIWNVRSVEVSIIECLNFFVSLFGL